MVHIQQSLQLLQLFPMRLERFVFLILLLNDLRLGLSLSILLSVAHIYSPRYLIECLPQLIVSNLSISKSLFLRLYALFLNLKISARLVGVRPFLTYTSKQQCPEGVCYIDLVDLASMKQYFITVRACIENCPKRLLMRKFPYRRFK